MPEKLDRNPSRVWRTLVMGQVCACRTPVLHMEPEELWLYPVLDCCFWGGLVGFFSPSYYIWIFSRTILPHVFSFCYVFASFTVIMFLEISLSSVPFGYVREVQDVSETRIPSVGKVCSFFFSSYQWLLATVVVKTPKCFLCVASCLKAKVV